MTGGPQSHAVQPVLGQYFDAHDASKDLSFSTDGACTDLRFSHAVCTEDAQSILKNTKGNLHVRNLHVTCMLGLRGGVFSVF